MKILKTSVAGSLESNDVFITISPNETKGVELVLESIVEKQFGDRIRKIILDILEEYEVEDAYVRVQDRGALSCTLKARIETAILRTKEGM